jgi:hypothetical protein
MYKFLFLKNSKISIFGRISKFAFGQILANSGSFGQFWAEFVAKALAESMPEARLKS